LLVVEEEVILFQVLALLVDRVEVEEEFLKP
jgi:hypothetical protein